MALVRNGLSLSCNPQRYMGAANAIVTARSVWNDPGAQRNWYIGDAVVSGVTDRLGFAPGYTHPTAWVLAPKGGGMVCRTIEGSGDIDSANLAGGKNMVASLDGTGDITNAALGLIAGMVATLSGEGTLTADITGALFAAANLSGSGDVTADLGALANLVASLSGTGGVTAGITATGAMSADIVVTGDLLTTANVGEAVWSAIIEAGYTADDVLKLISAVLLGESTGFATNPEFTGLDGATTRVAAALDSNGNRSSVVLNPD